MRGVCPKSPGRWRTWISVPILPLLLCVVACYSLAGCTRDESDDRRPPRFVGSSPHDGQTQVTTYWPLFLFLSERIDASTVDGTSVTLSDLTRSQQVPISVSTSSSFPDGPTPYVIRIDAPLVEATDYRLDVAETIEDKAGNSLEAPISVSFQTVVVARLLSPNPLDCLQWGGGGVICGDIDGDGLDDAVVKQGGIGAPLVVFFGPDLVRQASVVRDIAYCAVCQDLVGGDVNGDGYLDVAVTTMDLVMGILDVTVFLGPDLSSSFVVTDPLGGAFPRLGQVIAMGDVNGDGLSDLVCASGLAWDALVAFYGPDMGTYTVIPAPVEVMPGGGGFGAALAIGDIDGDGMGEVVAGAPYMAVDGQWDAGMVFVFEAPSLTAYKVFTDPSPTQLANFGSVVATGDAGGDGLNDLLVPVDHYNQGTAQILIWDGPDLASPRSIEDALGGAGGPAYGQVVVTDSNGDGAPDIVTGRPRLFGATRVLLGPTFDKSLQLHDPDGSSSIHWFGLFLDAGDVDGDGCSDLVIGEPAVCTSGIDDLGRAFVFFGP